MFHQPPSGFHQTLLQTRQRPAFDSSEQCQSPPQITQVVRQQAQREPHLVGAEPMAREASHPYGLLAFLDPLLGRSPFVIEPLPVKKISAATALPSTRTVMAAAPDTENLPLCQTPV